MTDLQTLQGFRLVAALDLASAKAHACDILALARGPEGQEMRSIRRQREQVISDASQLFQLLATKPHPTFEQLLIAASNNDVVMRHAGIDAVANCHSLRLSPCLTGQLSVGTVGKQRVLMAPVAGEGAHCPARHFHILAEAGKGHQLESKVACASEVVCETKAPRVTTTLRAA